MKYSALSLLVLLASLSAQTPRRSKEPEDINLPNGRKWSDVIAEADHAGNMKDARALAQLTAEIRDDIEAGGKFVLSVKTLRKLDDAEKLVKSLRGRLNKN
jgi:hypothetical protein